MVELKSLKEWDAKVGDAFVYHAGGQSSPTGTKREISKVSSSDYYSKDLYNTRLESHLSNSPYWSLVSRVEGTVVEETVDKKPDGGPAQQELLEHFKYEDGELIRIKASTTLVYPYLQAI